MCVCIYVPQQCVCVFLNSVWVCMFLNSVWVCMFSTVCVLYACSQQCVGMHAPCLAQLMAGERELTQVRSCCPKIRWLPLLKKTTLQVTCLPCRSAYFCFISGIQVRMDWKTPPPPNTHTKKSHQPCTLPALHSWVSDSTRLCPPRTGFQIAYASVSLGLGLKARTIMPSCSALWCIFRSLTNYIYINIM